MPHRDQFYQQQQDAPLPTQAVAGAQQRQPDPFWRQFSEPIVLLAQCIPLEGIVCKRKDAPYRSGPRCGWVKVKTSEWKEANRYRAKLFAKT